jgi:hypothetical protein
VKLKRRFRLRCGSCGKRYQNPLTHVCASPKADFRKRQTAHAKRQAAADRKARRAAVRKRETEARRARRKREEDARRARRGKERAAVRARTAKAAPASRPRRPAHPYRTCRDGDCQRPACLAYREGIETGASMAGES